MYNNDFFVVDNLLFSFLVDFICIDFETIKIDTTNIFPSLSQDQREQIKPLIMEIIENSRSSSSNMSANYLITLLKSPPKPLQTVLASFGSIFNSLSPTAQADFKTLAVSFFEMYNSGMRISRTIRYNTENDQRTHATIIATRNFDVGDVLKLTGIACDLDGEITDHSILYSMSKKKDLLLVGPARILNHDCCGYNVIPIPRSNIVTFRVEIPIKNGNEVLTYYGDNFFGENNKECRCLSCEKRGINGFATTTTAQRFRQTKARAAVNFNYFNQIDEEEVQEEQRQSTSILPSGLYPSLVAATSETTSRPGTEENALLICCKDVLSKTTAKLTVNEIYQEIKRMKLYDFKNAKTPERTINARMHDAVKKGNYGFIIDDKKRPHRFGLM